tara:strand:+ start:6376 stop:7068 length:693 start_codon:yes stop_codon:yes gene_type:complete
MLQEKKCKGTHKYTFGIGCGIMTPIQDRQFGIGKKCGCWKAWLQTDKADEFLTGKIIPKAKKTVATQERKKNTEARSLNQDWSKKLQTEINKIVRTIDKGLTCLARKYRGQMHAGHVYARGGNSTIKYNLHNIHRQCSQSNRNQNDDGLLREGLVNEYGQSYMDFISELRRTPSLTFNNVEYRELTEKARVVLKSLTDADKIYTKSERIEMRNRINLELKIYALEFCEYA